MAHRPAVAVIGASNANPELVRTARRVGKLLAESGALVITGGGAGVMRGASHGASLAGGLVVGILPGGGPAESLPNPYVQVAVYTGLGDARNAVIVRSAGAVIAIGGGFGTLSEIGLALKAGRPVILLGSWTLQPPEPLEGFDGLLRTADSPGEAVALAVALAGAAIPETEPPAEPDPES